MIQSLVLPIMRRKKHPVPGPSGPRKKILLKIRVTRLCARRSRTPNLFQLSRNYCPSALRSSVNIFPFMLGSSRKEHKGAGFLHGRATTHWLKIITHRLQRGHLPATRCSPPFPSLDKFSPSAHPFLFPLSPTLRLLIYLALVPTKAKQATATELAAEERNSADKLKVQFFLTLRKIGVLSVRTFCTNGEKARSLLITSNQISPACKIWRDINLC